MKISELTDALQTMPQDADILGVFVQRVGEMSTERVQEYKVRIAADHKGTKTTVQFHYYSVVQEKKDQAPFKQKPFAAALTKMFT